MYSKGFVLEVKKKFVVKELLINLLLVINGFNSYYAASRDYKLFGIL
jgi:hypothetical protein